MARIKAPHHVADRQYIFSGQQIMTPDALWNCDCDRSMNHHAGNLSAHGLACRPQSFGLGVALQDACPCVFVFLFTNPSPPSPYLHLGCGHLESHHIYSKCSGPYLHAQTYSSKVFSYQLLQSLANSTCINIRVYSFSACGGEPLRSETCFLTSCSPCCSPTSSHCFVLFMSHIEVPLPSSRANLAPWLPLDCSIQHPCVRSRVSSSNSLSVLLFTLSLFPLSFFSPVSVQCFSLRWRRCCLPSGWLHSRLTVCCSPLVTPCCCIVFHCQKPHWINPGIFRLMRPQTDSRIWIWFYLKEIPLYPSIGNTQHITCCLCLNGPFY